LHWLRIFFGFHHLFLPFSKHFQKLTITNFKPEKVKDSKGIWVNLFDADDIAGYPIRPVNNHCKKCGDCRSQFFGWVIFFQGTHQPVTLVIGAMKRLVKLSQEKLTIDWLRTNKWGTRDQTLKRVTAYKKL
jgi:hypothetical protein